MSHAQDHHGHAHGHGHGHGGAGITLVAPGAHFDSIAALYNASLPPHVVRHYLDKRVAFVQRRIPAPGRLLDVGCGTGLLAQRLSERGFTVTGLDLSLGMLLQGGRALRYVQGDGAALPFPDGTFDGAVTVAALHHMFDPRTVADTIREMLRVTRSGGAVVIWDHNPLNPYWPLLMRRLPQDDEDTRLVPAGEILRAVREAGAQEVQVVRTGWVADFIPRWGLRPMQALEAILERTPLVKELSAHNVVVARP
jgi:ubiquinone/menaquinone biosynthesis C-methylase UbiE